MQIGSRLGVIHEIVALLRKWKYLVCVDQSHSLIWLFDRAEHEHLRISPHQLLELLSQEGFHLLGKIACSLTG